MATSPDGLARMSFQAAAKYPPTPAATATTVANAAQPTTYATLLDYAVRMIESDDKLSEYFRLTVQTSHPRSLHYTTQSRHGKDTIRNGVVTWHATSDGTREMCYDAEAVEIVGWDRTTGQVSSVFPVVSPHLHMLTGIIKGTAAFAATNDVAHAAESLAREAKRTKYQPVIRRGPFAGCAVDFSLNDGLCFSGNREYALSIVSLKYRGYRDEDE